MLAKPWAAASLLFLLLWAASSLLYSLSSPLLSLSLSASVLFAANSHEPYCSRFDMRDYPRDSFCTCPCCPKAVFLRALSENSTVCLSSLGGMSTLVQ